MKLLSSLSLVLITVISACKSDPTKTDSYVHSKIDSLVGIKMEEVNMQAVEDLDRRLSIEVKQKADSIIAARRAQIAKSDSAAGALSATATMPQ